MEENQLAEAGGVGAPCSRITMPAAEWVLKHTVRFLSTASSPSIPRKIAAGGSGRRASGVISGGANLTSKRLELTDDAISRTASERDPGEQHLTAVAPEGVGEGYRRRRRGIPAADSNGGTRRHKRGEKTTAIRQATADGGWSRGIRKAARSQWRERRGDGNRDHEEGTEGRREQRNVAVIAGHRRISRAMETEERRACMVKPVPAQFSFAAQFLFLAQSTAAAQSFSWPSSRAPSSLFFLFSLADAWAPLVGAFFFPEPSSSRTRRRVPAAPVSTSASPSRKFLWPFIRRRLEPLTLPNQSPSFRALSSRHHSRNPRRRLAASISSPRFAVSFLSLSRALSRLRDLAVATEPPLVAVSSLRCVPHIASFLPSLESWKTEFPSSSFAHLRRNAAAVEPSHPEPLDRNPTAEITPVSRATFAEKPLKNGPFEGDQDQVYEEEPSQYFEEGNRHRFVFLRSLTLDHRAQIPFSKDQPPKTSTTFLHGIFFGNP
nr:unnamed protein product [Digitaria exilis]